MIFVPFAVEYVYISQIFEWMAMVFVIVSQKSRTVDEILYDQQNSYIGQMKSSFKSKRHNYRQFEIVLKWFFITYFVLRVLLNLFTTITEISCTNVVHIP